MIFDHGDIDIVLSPTNNKVLALSKDQYGDHIYATQSRLFEHLVKNGGKQKRHFSWIQGKGPIEWNINM